MNSERLNCINIGDTVDLDKLLKLIFNEYILTFIDWDGTGTITCIDAIRTVVASAMIILTPHGLYILRCIVCNIPPSQDATFFIVLHAIISVISAVIVFIFSIAIFMDMVGNLSKIELYKYR